MHAALRTARRRGKPRSGFFHGVEPRVGIGAPGQNARCGDSTTLPTCRLNGYTGRRLFSGASYLVTRRLWIAGVFAILMAVTSTLGAQWPSYPTPGVPRLADGKPNLEAPTPRTA